MMTCVCFYNFVPKFVFVLSLFRRITDAHLDVLARRFPCGQYTRICNAVGIGYDEANSLLVRFSSDYERATRHVLANWNAVTGGSRRRLETALRAADVGGLCDVLDEEISSGIINIYEIPDVKFKVALQNYELQFAHFECE